jgi:hypothetical protein
VRSTDHYTPHYVIFSTPITLSLLGPNILLSTLFNGKSHYGKMNSLMKLLKHTAHTGKCK